MSSTHFKEVNSSFPGAINILSKPLIIVGENVGKLEILTIFS